MLYATLLNKTEKITPITIPINALISNLNPNRFNKAIDNPMTIAPNKTTLFSLDTINSYSKNLYKNFSLLPVTQAYNQINSKQISLLPKQ